ncbi:hypothetical protein PEP31012_00921 [Pandoraea eparura]|jgi:hypothetical protein|uniref:Uncharacterized protein n=1 Tax=Pandoraea eparura TaxID=2508291 RepID=A0A5E4SRM5_9BURK|nr:hypothetical protein [Pandoraea eparura]VVD77543.1 hypothetical protein PEP31012_00921 [Pandoraea eparura]
MRTLHRSGLSADAFVSAGDRSSSPRRDTTTPGVRRSDNRRERTFSLACEPAACVSGPADVLRWLRVWHARQEANWDGGSSLRVLVHGGALDTLVVEARRGRQGVTVSLLCVQLTMYRRLLAHRGRLERALTSRLKLPVMIEVEARYAP